MSILGVFILTTAIGVGTSRSPASEQKDAYKALAKATFIQTETDKIVKDMEKKYIPKVIKEYGGVLTGVTRVIVDQKVSIEWKF